MRNIDDICYRLTQGDCKNTAAVERAKELFQKAFRVQMMEKEGKKDFKRSKGPIRQKFSKRKQLVIACLKQAFDELLENDNPWTVDSIIFCVC